LRISFDSDFDQGAWPSPCTRDHATAGFACLGPDEFLAVLETHLGLATLHASLADRAAELVPRLFRKDRFYGASATIDPWATAQRLLTWRDELWMHGWRGESLAERRLGELAEVTLGLPPGPAERLEVVAGWLPSRRVDIEHVQLFAPKTAWPVAWQRVLTLLVQAGTRVTVDPLPTARAAGNLAALRSPPAFVHTNDTTLQLVRCHGPREAARLVASALAADSAIDNTVFVGPDAILDEALAEFGLPTLGARPAHDVSALAALLPVTLQLAWGPLDPQLALDWLTLPDKPLETTLAARLAETLGVWPAVGNPAWRAVVNQLPKNDSARTVLQTVFAPLADRQSQIRVRDFLPRIELLLHWASARAASSSAYALVVTQAQLLRRRFTVAELNRLTPPKLDAVLASIINDAAKGQYPAHAGYASVGLPGGVSGPAQRIIWWNFHESNARRTRLTLRASERRALAAIGVTLPSLGEVVGYAASRARRPLLQATESLVLVAPHHDEPGEPAQLHPLWDEVIGRLHNSRDERHLVVNIPVFHKPIARTKVLVGSPVPPLRTHRASLPLAPRAADSPSSLSKLLGCSYSYALDYIGRLRPCPSPRLVVEARLHGLLAHEVLAEAARRSGFLGRTHDEARQLTLSILDAYLPTHAALLMLHGYQQDLVLLRDALGRTAELLARVMVAEGLRIHAIEEEVRTDVAGRVLRGTPDLVLIDSRDRLILLDFKWSGETYRREELRSGTFLQLAAYAMMLERSGHAVRSLGYLILRSGHLLIRGEPLAFAERIGSSGASETWIAAERAWQQRITEISRGELHAAGVVTDDSKPLRRALIDQGSLLLPPPCTYCKLDLLCGRGNDVP